MTKNLRKSSLEQIEALAVGQYKQDLRRSHALQELLAERWLKLREEFAWNDENVKKLLWVNEKLTECLTKAKAETETLDRTLKERLTKGDFFLNDYEIEIALQPFILQRGDDGYMQEPENNIYAVLNGSCEDLKISFSELNRPDNIFFSPQLNWADLLPGFAAFTGKKHAIGYAVHVLYEHCHWSMQDILQINEIWAEVNVKITHFSEKLYAGYVQAEHADWIKIKK